MPGRYWFSLTLVAKSQVINPYTTVHPTQFTCPLPYSIATDFSAHTHWYSTLLMRYAPPSTAASSNSNSSHSPTGLLLYVLPASATPSAAPQQRGSAAGAAAVTAAAAVVGPPCPLPAVTASFSETGRSAACRCVNFTGIPCISGCVKSDCSGLTLLCCNHTRDFAMDSLNFTRKPELAERHQLTAVREIVSAERLGSFHPCPHPHNLEQCSRPLVADSHSCPVCVLDVVYRGFCSTLLKPTSPERLLY